MVDAPLPGRPGRGLPDRVPCGAMLDDLLEQVADSTPPADLAHQGTCPHCRAALAELGDLWTPVRRLAAVDVTAPPTLTSTIMERVHAMAAHGWHAVLTGQPGVTRIAAWVVAVIARRAVAGVPGVGTVVGQVTPPAAALGPVTAEYPSDRPSRAQRGAAAGIGVAGRRVVVRVAVTAAAGIPLPALAEQIRRRVSAEVSTLTGLIVAAVDVEVTDLDRRQPSS
ncbi:Uncharacterized conserved protein YloU, alkaline shock protein (Asp23) family [Modestobacter sp. DSM 44400]|uniref:Asp23/Gls24 family envelope stress response protein n=1 Tax=Modestobacter sp. DSM 44400 TaxID=1550230 RepID=UPI0008997C28|nr:Asp23/Gls24 family envelope stress response protein [Modestobacter sp. DSM 44400]SDY67365.1 Uncharacterized conserved protein YloU, alkaline shock protein (Asp23) family [Modestobacter sp. DSM 44400]